MIAQNTYDDLVSKPKENLVRSFKQENWNKSHDNFRNKAWNSGPGVTEVRWSGSDKIQRLDWLWKTLKSRELIDGLWVKRLEYII